MRPSAVLPFAAVIALAGCMTSSAPPLRLLDAVASCAPIAPPLDSQSRGVLVVWSARIRVPSATSAMDIEMRSSYKIFSDAGDFLSKIQNTDGYQTLEPQPIWLAPGTYVVLAQAAGYGPVSVPIVIRANEITLVDLEGDAPWPDRMALLRSNPVRLPNGEIIGWPVVPGNRSPAANEALSATTSP